MLITARKHFISMMAVLMDNRFAYDSNTKIPYKHQRIVSCGIYLDVAWHCCSHTQQAANKGYTFDVIYTSARYCKQ